MAPARLILACLVALSLHGSACAARPAPVAATSDLFTAPSGSQFSRAQYGPSAHDAQQQQPLPAATDAAPLDAAATLDAAEASAASVVGLTWGYHLEQLMQQLEAREVQLAPPQQQQDAAALLSKQVEALAVQVIAASRANIAELGAQLRSSVPAGTTAAAMASLLQSSAFHGSLKSSMDEAMAIVGAALEPHLNDVAETVHAALCGLALEAGSVESLSDFSDTFVPHFASSFSLSIVEATLLRALWHDL
ncbi:hypothetical protein D9Q98_008939 [Chlorella vulgaris]|uniref:Uncharacterized protein n=1 Tax=Chlorella vulgaris TaxID=3077 RepID=A0A9D4YTC1_CHLVU|nr:hypothetical protein D9Q98_008938 [Chlorella vulgaris]KAI3425168.1 hypothetical protein D9Q98_008939 [Chlorella vulgaris]